MTTPSEPLTQVYEALWSLLNASSEFSRLVKLQNRIAFTAADLPEVRLIPTELTLHQGRTSSSTSVELTFELQVATGDQRLDVELFPLAWAIIKATSNWQATMAALTWQSVAFVVQTLLSEAQIGVSQADLNRGIKGWSSIWKWTALTWFTTTDLQA